VQKNHCWRNHPRLCIHQHHALIEIFVRLVGRLKSATVAGDLVRFLMQNRDTKVEHRSTLGTIYSNSCNLLEHMAPRYIAREPLTSTTIIVLAHISVSRLLIGNAMIKPVLHWDQIFLVVIFASRGAAKTPCFPHFRESN
jgi:hypothetical protein